MRRSRSLQVFFALAASVGAVSCAAVLGFERLSTEDGIVFDAGVDSAPEASASLDAGPDACGDIGIPEPPDAGGGGSAEIFAVNTLDFGIDDESSATTVPPGLNLDRTCSPTLPTSTCKTNITADQFTSLKVSDHNAAGLDNASIGLFRFMNRRSDLLKASTLNRGIAAGKYGATLRVKDWNHQADDGEVEVELFPAIGREPRADEDAGFGPDDRWVLDEHYRLPGTSDDSQIVSTAAWVAGNRLVARFRTASLPFLISSDPKPFEVTLQDVVLVATLANDNGVATLKGATLAGRWKTSDFLGQVRTIYFENDGELVDVALCEPQPDARRTYIVVRDIVCLSRDIRADSKDGQNLGCDAVSAALRLETYPVTNLGVFQPRPEIDVEARCSMEGRIDAGDDCPPN